MWAAGDRFSPCAFWRSLLARLPPRPTARPTDSLLASTPTHGRTLHAILQLQGDGVPPTEAREFCDWLSSSGAPRLSGLPFSVCALGDK